MKLIDATVPLDSALTTDANHTPEMQGLPLQVVESDGAPARVVLRSS